MKYKTLVVALIALLCVGCDNRTPNEKIDSDVDYFKRSTICIDGVVYISAYRVMTVKFKRDSTVETCDT